MDYKGKKKYVQAIGVYWPGSHLQRMIFVYGKSSASGSRLTFACTKHGASGSHFKSAGL
jgi:hypothetical protein